MCNYVSFVIGRESGHLYCNKPDSHSGIEDEFGLKPGSYREGEWEPGKALTVRTYGGEDENWYKSAVLQHYDCWEHLACDLVDAALGEGPPWVTASPVGAYFWTLKAGELGLAKKLERRLPEKIVVYGALYLEGCTGLTSLPDSLNVRGSLDLRGCTGLTSLPDNLAVGEDLDLSDCTGLTSLPDSLNVRGSLDLRGCTGLTSLPDNLTVGGNIYISGCTSLPDSAIPEHLRHRVVRLF